MSTSSDQVDYTELAGKIQQFLSHQIESNGDLSEAAKESLTVATECIEQAYNIQRKPASKELLDTFRASKSKPTSQSTSQTSPLLTGNNANPLPTGQDPAQLITNLASTLFSQVGASLAGASFANPAGAAQPGHQQTTTSTEAQQQQPQQPQPSAPPKPKSRKKASEAEKLAAESFKNQGNDFMKQDKYKEAYDCYTQAIDIDNNNAVYYCNRAAASAKLGNHQAALSDCEEAIEIDSNYSKAYGRMGLAYASMENHQKAKEAYVKAVELDPTNESYRNNLQIAEAALAEGQGSGSAQSAAGAGAGGPNVVNMLRNMMNNPEVMSIAMRSLQDPRVQSMFGLGGAGGGAPNANQPR